MGAATNLLLTMRKAAGVAPESLTVYPETSDGYIESQGSGTDYTAARNGTGTLSIGWSTTQLFVGQQAFSSFFRRVFESFLNFDVSGMTEDADSATLSLWLVNDSTGSADFTVQARARDWGDTLETSDFVPGDDLSGLTLLASIDTTSIGSTGAYKALTSEAALVTAINTARAGDGILRLILCSSRTTDNVPAAVSERVIFSSADEADTTQDPKLEITYG